MSGLILIKYGKDSNGNILSLAVNPSSVGSTFAGATGFFISLDSVNTTTVLPSLNNFSTNLAFYGTTGSDVSFMKTSWIDAIAQLETFPQIVTLDFQSPGFIFTQTIVSA